MFFSISLHIQDDELMARIAGGDGKAFQTLFDRHSKKVLGYARRLMGDIHRAEDISQEVWMKVIRNASQYKASTHFNAWVLTMTRNSCFDLLRSSAQKDRSLQTEEEGEIQVPDLEAKDVEQQLIEASDKVVVRQKIEELPQDQRVLIIAWITEDLNYEELSELSGKSISAVKSLLFRAKQNLERALKVAL